MDKFMDSPWFLRLTALALALFLFFSVRAEMESSSLASTGDSVDMIRDVPVEVYYDNENYVVTGVPETVNMTIKGPASLVQSTKLMKDFALKVDLRSMTLGSHTVQIQHENLSDKLEVHLEPATINVNIEEKISKSFRVDPELNDKMLAEDYTLVNMEVEPSTIEVTGAKSAVEAISFVKVSVTGEEEISKSFEQVGRVRVLDRDLNKLNVTIEPEEVTVKVDVEAYHKEVPVVVKQTGEPKKGITVNSLTSDEKTVSVYGPRKAVDAVEQVTASVDLSKISGNGKQTVGLEKPKGISKLSKDKVDITIDVQVDGDAADTEDEPGQADEEAAAVSDQEENSSDLAAGEEPAGAGSAAEQEAASQKKTKKFTNIPIGIQGLDKQFSGTISKPADGAAAVTLTGEEQAIAALEETDISITADASSITTAGEHTAGITIQVPLGIQVEVGFKEVTIRIEQV